MPSTIDGVRPGRHQDLPSGSSATLPVPAGELADRTSRSRSSSGRRLPGVASRSSRAAVVRSMATAGRWCLGSGRARARHRGAPARRDARIATGIAAAALGRGISSASTVEDGVAAVSHRPWRDRGADDRARTHRDGRRTCGPIADDDGHAGLLAATADGDRRTRHFDGRLDRPRLIGRRTRRGGPARPRGRAGRARRRRRRPHRRLGLQPRHRERRDHRRLRPRPPRHDGQPADARRHRPRLHRRGDRLAPATRRVRRDPLPSRRPRGRRLGGRLRADDPGRPAERDLRRVAPRRATTRTTCRSRSVRHAARSARGSPS